MEVLKEEYDRLKRHEAAWEKELQELSDGQDDRKQQIQEILKRIAEDKERLERVLK